MGLCDLSCIDLVKSMLPDSKIIVFTMMDEIVYGLDVMKYGVKGFVSKNTSGETLINAIRKVNDGGVYLSNKLSVQLTNQLILPQTTSLDTLSKREKEVLIFLGSGLSVTLISEKLFLSIKTVSTYKRRVMQKLNLRNIADIIRFCIAHNLQHTPITKQ